MGPGSHECRSLFIDRSTLLEGVEKRVTERELQLGKVDADAIAAKSIDGLERSLSIEDTARNQRMNMGMKIQQTSKRLRGRQESGDRSVDVREARLERFADDAVCRAAEVAVEPGIEEECAPEDLPVGAGHCPARGLNV